MTIFDSTNLDSRQVITPDGEGTLIGFDDKDNPKIATVMIRVEGKKLRKPIAYAVDELQEVK